MDIHVEEEGHDQHDNLTELSKLLEALQHNRFENLDTSGDTVQEEPVKSIALLPNEARVLELLHARLDPVQDLTEPLPFEFATDKLAAEVLEVTKPRNDVASVYTKMLEFWKSHIASLELLTFQLMVRWTRHCTTNEQIERTGPFFCLYLSNVSKALHKALIRYEALQRDYFATIDPYAGMSKFRHGSSPADEEDVQARHKNVTSDDIEELMMYEISSQQSSMMFRQFLARIKWVSLESIDYQPTENMKLHAKAHGNLHERSSSTSPLKSDSHTKAGYEACPELPTTADKVHRAITACLSHFWDVAWRPDRDGVQSLRQKKRDDTLLYNEVTRRFSIAFDEQSKMNRFRSYEEMARRHFHNRRAAPVSPGKKGDGHSPSSPLMSPASPRYQFSSMRDDEESEWKNEAKAPVGFQFSELATSVLDARLLNIPKAALPPRQHEETELKYFYMKISDWQNGIIHNQKVASDVNDTVPPLVPIQTPHALRQSRKLQGVKEKVDGTLVAINDFVDLHDMAEVRERVKGVAQAHLNEFAESADITIRDLAEVKAFNDYSQSLNLADSYDPSVLEMYLPVAIESQLDKLECLYLIRVVRLRNFKYKVLSTLNYFRSLQKKLCIDSFNFESRKFEQNMYADEQTFLSHLCDGKGVKGNFEFIERADVHSQASDGFPGLIYDAHTGAAVVYDLAFEDMRAVEEELLAVGTFLIAGSQPTPEIVTEMPMDGDEPDAGLPKPVHELLGDVSGEVDRWELLSNLFENEANYQKAKYRAVEAYHEAYVHCIDAKSQALLAQRIVNLIAARPRLTLETDRVTVMSNMKGETKFLNSLADLLNEMIAHIKEEEDHSPHSFDKFVPLESQVERIPLEAELTSTSKKADVFHFYPLLVQTVEFMDTFDAVREQILNYSTDTDDTVSQLYFVGLDLKLLERMRREYRYHRMEKKGIPISQHFGIVDEFQNSVLFTDAVSAISSLRGYATALKEQAEEKFHEDSQDAKSSHNLNNDRSSDVVEENFLQPYLNYLEVFHLRNEILRLLFESVMLTRKYFEQAQSIGLDAHQTLLDLFATGMISYSMPSISGELGTLAIIEAQRFFPGQTMNTLREIPKLIVNQNNSIQVLRLCLEFQITQTRALSMVVQTHHLLRSTNPGAIDTEQVFFGKRSPRMKNRNRTSLSKKEMDEEAMQFVKTEFSLSLPGVTEAEPVPSPKELSVPRSRPGSRRVSFSAQEKRLMTIQQQNTKKVQIGLLSPATFIDIVKLKAQARELAITPVLNDPNCKGDNTQMFHDYCQGFFSSLSTASYVSEMLHLRTRYERMHTTKFRYHSPFSNSVNEAVSLEAIELLFQKPSDHFPVGEAEDVAGTPTRMPPLRRGPENARINMYGERIRRLMNTVYHIPQPSFLVMLLAAVHHRGEHQLNVPLLRSMCISQKVVFDTARLQIALGQCEQLQTFSSIEDSKNTKSMEVAGKRLDAIKNELRQADLKTEREPWLDLQHILISHRNIIWYRNTMMLRCFNESTVSSGNMANFRALLWATRAGERDDKLAALSHQRFHDEDVLGWYPSVALYSLPHMLSMFSTPRLCKQFEHIASHESHHMDSLLRTFDKDYGLRHSNTKAKLRPTLTHEIEVKFRNALILARWFDAYFFEYFHLIDKVHPIMDTIKAPKVTLEHRKKKRKPTHIGGPKVNFSNVTPFNTGLNSPPRRGKGKSPPRRIAHQRPRIDVSLVEDNDKKKKQQEAEHSIQSLFAPARETVGIICGISNKHKFRDALVLVERNLVEQLNARRLELFESQETGRKEFQLRTKLSLFMEAHYQLKELREAEEEEVNDDGRQGLIQALPDQYGSVKTEGLSVQHDNLLRLKENSLLTPTRRRRRVLVEADRHPIHRFVPFCLQLSQRDQTALMEIFDAELRSVLHSHTISKLELILEHLNELNDTSPQGDSKPGRLAKTPLIVESKGINHMVYQLWHDLHVSSLSAVQLQEEAAEPRRHANYYVIPKHEMSDIISSLMKNLIVLSQRAPVLGQGPIVMINRHLSNLDGRLKDQVRHKNSQYENEKRCASDRKHQLTVDTQYKHIIDNQELREKLVILKQAIRDEEAVVMRELRTQFESERRQLHLNAINARNKLLEDKASIQPKVAAHYYKIRQASLREMVESGRAPYGVKRKALRDMAKEDRVMQLKMEQFELQATILKLDTVFRMKNVIAENAYQRQMEDCNAKLALNEHNAKLLANFAQRQKVLNAELASIQTEMLSSHKSSQIAKNEVEVNRVELQQLKEWKRGQADKLAKLEHKIRTYDDMGELGVDALEEQLGAEEKELQYLQSHYGQYKQRLDRMKDSFERRQAELQQLVDTESALIRKATHRLRAVNKSRVNGVTNPDKERHTWAARAIAADQNYKATMLENQRLKELLAKAKKNPSRGK